MGSWRRWRRNLIKNFILKSLYSKGYIWIFIKILYLLVLLRDKTMKKIIPLLLLSLIILCPIIAESADATTLFLTSDNLHEHDADFARLNDIKERIESKTNGDIVVVVDD